MIKYQAVIKVAQTPRTAIKLANKTANSGTAYNFETTL